MSAFAIMPKLGQQIYSFTVTVTTTGTPVTVMHDKGKKLLMIAYTPTESGTFIAFSQPSISDGSFTIDASVNASTATIYCREIFS